MRDTARGIHWILNMFKIGTTSYIYPADILTNVRKLAGKVHDIELVFFELQEKSNFPDRDLIEDLIDVSQRYGTSYTIHLPLDLALAGETPDIEKAARLIGLTRRLQPSAYVVHLDGADHKNTSSLLANSLASLKTLVEVAEDGTLLCIENLESQPAAFIDAILERMPVSTCVDIGHLWKRGKYPLPLLARRLNRTRIVHLHGLRGRDHQSLTFVPPL